MRHFKWDKKYCMQFSSSLCADLCAISPRERRHLKKIRGFASKNASFSIPILVAHIMIVVCDETPRFLRYSRKRMLYHSSSHKIASRKQKAINFTTSIGKQHHIIVTMAFDPKDKKYQVSEEFPPNKEETWKFPMEKDGEALIVFVIP